MKTLYSSPETAEVSVRQKDPVLLASPEGNITESVTEVQYDGDWS